MRRPRAYSLDGEGNSPTQDDVAWGIIRIPEIMGSCALYPRAVKLHLPHRHASIRELFAIFIRIWHYSFLMHYAPLFKISHLEIIFYLEITSLWLLRICVWSYNKQRDYRDLISCLKMEKTRWKHRARCYFSGNGMWTSSSASDAEYSSECLESWRRVSACVLLHAFR